LRIRLPHIVAPILVSLALLPGCGKDKKSPVAPLTGLAPDFALTDVNPNSTTYGQAVSPRRHLGRISAWYFAHAT